MALGLLSTLVIDSFNPRWDSSGGGGEMYIMTRVPIPKGVTLLRSEEHHCFTGISSEGQEGSSPHVLLLTGVRVGEGLKTNVVNTLTSTSIIA